MSALPETMKCLVKAKSEKGIWLEERPVPSIEPGFFRPGLCTHHRRFPLKFRD